MYLVLSSQTAMSNGSPTAYKVNNTFFSVEVHMFNLALTVNVIVHVLRGLEAFNSLFNA